MEQISNRQAVSVEALRGLIQGDVFAPNEQGFNEARFAWNVTIDQQPDLVVVPASVEDVQTAVKYAADRGWAIAAQTTGHGQPRCMKGGLLLNMRRLNQVTLDGNLAKIGGGAIWKDVMTVSQPAGLAPLSGSSPNVGVVGYTLGGGYGLMIRKYGLAIDSVRAVELVTADGSLKSANRYENPDLFRCLLGGGGTMGVVTQIEMELVPEAMVYGGSVLFPAERSAEIYEFYAEWAKTLPEDVSTAIIAMTFPPVPFVPEPLRGNSYAIVTVCATGDTVRAEALIKPLTDLEPVMAHLGSMPYSETACIYNDPVDPLPAIGQGVMLNDFDAEAAAALLDAIGPQPTSPNLMIQLRHIDGASARLGGCDSMGSRRRAKYLLYLLGVPMGPATPEAMHEQAQRVFAALADHVVCPGPLNWLGERDVPADAIRSFYEDESFDHLAEMKRAHDPDNRFRYSGVGVVLGE